MTLAKGRSEKLQVNIKKKFNHTMIYTLIQAFNTCTGHGSAKYVTSLPAPPF
jgi:hypothetical protein